MKFSDLRKKIDKIDNNILKLFELRMHYIEKIAKYKSENNLNISDDNRELCMLNRFKKSSNSKYLSENSILLKVIINLSKSHQFKRMGLKSSCMKSILLNEINRLKRSPKALYCTSLKDEDFNIITKYFRNYDIIECYNATELFFKLKQNKSSVGVLKTNDISSLHKVYSLVECHNVYISSVIRDFTVISSSLNIKYFNKNDSTILCSFNKQNLFDVFLKFFLYNIDIISIQTYIGRIYIEFMGNIKNENIKCFVNELRYFTKKFKILGYYKKLYE